MADGDEQATEVEEEQHFVLTLNGPVDFETVESNAYCIVQGLAERVPLKLLRRDPLLKPDGSMPRGMKWLQAMDRHAWGRATGFRLYGSCFRCLLAAGDAGQTRNR
mgnify:CR=1 FL=1